jgi:hypothetical protein
MTRLRNGGIIEAREYVNKTLEEATKHAENGGFITRIVEKDGQTFMLDMDAKGNRLNFRVSKGIVTDVFGG